MRGVVWLVLLFAAAVLAATALGRNDGLVSLAWRGTVVELSLNLALALVVLWSVLCVVVWRALDSLLALPRRAGEWRALQRERAAQAALRESLADFFAARYSRAHKAAQRAMQLQGDLQPGETGADFDSGAPLRPLAALLAAVSLHRMRDPARRDAAWAEASSAPAAGTAAAWLAAMRPGPAALVQEGAQLLKAEWALDDGDAAAAWAALGQMPPGVARRTHALRLKLRAARQTDRAAEALGTARLLAKHQAFGPGAARGLLRTLALQAIDSARDADALRKLWHEHLDATDRSDPWVVARAARAAVALGRPDEARQWLTPLWERLETLNAEDRCSVALALVRARAGAGPDWLQRADDAFARLPADGAVALAAGTLYAERQLWGRARVALQTAAGDTHLPAADRRDALQRLADIARQAGEPAVAARHEAAAAALR